MGISRSKSLHLLLFTQARSVVSAAVRLNVLGPYQAQTVLLGLQPKVEILAKKGDGLQVFNDVPYFQSDPVLDIVSSRHPQLYSKLFNS